MTDSEMTYLLIQFLTCAASWSALIMFLSKKFPRFSLLFLVVGSLVGAVGGALLFVPT